MKLKHQQLQHIQLFLFLSVIITSMSLTSCGTQNYNLLKETIQANNEVSSSINKSKYLYKPSKSIFKKYQDSISSDYLYIITFVNNLPVITENYSISIYDRVTNKYYFLYTSIEEPNKLIESESKEAFREHIFIYKKYEQNEISELLNLPEPSGSANLDNEFTLADVKNKRVFIIQDLLLDEKGKLILDTMNE